MLLGVECMHVRIKRPVHGHTVRQVGWQMEQTPHQHDPCVCEKLPLSIHVADPQFGWQRRLSGEHPGARRLGCTQFDSVAGM